MNRNSGASPAYGTSAIAAIEQFVRFQRRDHILPAAICILIASSPLPHQVEQALHKFVSQHSILVALLLTCTRPPGTETVESGVAHVEPGALAMMFACKDII